MRSALTAALARLADLLIPAPLAMAMSLGLVHRDEPAGEQQGDGENGGGQ